MTRWTVIVNPSRGGRLVRARWCDSFVCRLRGLSLTRRLPKGEGLLLVEPRPSRMGAAIHMAGMFYALGVVWIADGGLVVDTRLARPWRIYWPSAPARFTLEAEPAILERIYSGDRLEFVDERAA